MRLIAIFIAVCSIVGCVATNYKPTWESIDSRPLPSWYDEAKFGIFIHWGVFSVPSFGSEWFWNRWQNNFTDYVEFMKKNYRPGFTYADFASQFTSEFYDPDSWADLFKASGARYVVLTSKHHEGYTNWPSNVSFNWNSMAVGAKKDHVGMLERSIRKRTDIHFGLYHSLFEWFNPLYLQDKSLQFQTNRFVTGKTMPELYEIVNTYKPELIWSDGSAGPDWYWNSTKFLAWLYNESPVKDTVVVNDRWGDGCACKHGGYFTCHDRYNPGKLQNHKWENAMTIDKSSWGFRREMTLEDTLSMEDITRTFAETVSCGGNMLMNIGPTKAGTIVPIFEERLRQMGSWLGVNGEAVYSSKPWKYQNDTTNKDVWYTSKKVNNGTNVYAYVLSWPENNMLKLGAPTATSKTTVTMLGFKGPSFKYEATGIQGIVITIPPISERDMPCQWAWIIKLEHLRY